LVIRREPRIYHLALCFYPVPCNSSRCTLFRKPSDASLPHDVRRISLCMVGGVSSFFFAFFAHSGGLASRTREKLCQAHHIVSEGPVSLFPPSEMLDASPPSSNLPRCFERVVFCPPFGLAGEWTFSFLASYMALGLSGFFFTAPRPQHPPPPGKEIPPPGNAEWALFEPCYFPLLGQLFLFPGVDVDSEGVASIHIFSPPRLQECIVQTEIVGFQSGFLEIRPFFFSPPLNSFLGWLLLGHTIVRIGHSWARSFF